MNSRHFRRWPRPRGERRLPQPPGVTTATGCGARLPGEPCPRGALRRAGCECAAAASAPSVKSGWVGTGVGPAGLPGLWSRRKGAQCSPASLDPSGGESSGPRPRGGEARGPGRVAPPALCRAVPRGPDPGPGVCSRPGRTGRPRGRRRGLFSIFSTDRTPALQLWVWETLEFFPPLRLKVILALKLANEDQRGSFHSGAKSGWLEA